MSSKITIFYGSTTGNTKSAAEKIKEQMGEAELVDAADLSKDILESSDILILGTSTWGIGDIQDEWAGSLDILSGASLSGKKAAVFGLGDQYSYTDSFVDGMRDLYDATKQAGAEIIGEWPTDGYTFTTERPVIDDKFVGLALDEDNESDKTDERITKWVSQIKEEAGI
jgi:flavodoxin I